MPAGTELHLLKHVAVSEYNSLRKIFVESKSENVNYHYLYLLMYFSFTQNSFFYSNQTSACLVDKLLDMI